MKTQSPFPDSTFARNFQDEVASRIPHEDPSTGKIANPTPLVDITQTLAAYVNNHSGMARLASDVRVFGKFDSKVFGGSVKVRPAVQIIAEAIAKGALTQGMTVFEATSGNFGMALALLRRLDLQVVALVSRRLQPGVLERLNAEGVKLVNLDVDICPAPGFAGDANRMVAKGLASSVRQQLKDAGLSPQVFDSVRIEAEEALARQDVIELAKLLAKAYDGFCPHQYDNDLNVRAHESVTGPEIAQQLLRMGESPIEYQLVSSFGTGGTATGISRYMRETFGVKAVHVVFPFENQDVAGIRTKTKAMGLRFYRPEEYASELQVDFGRARPLMDFMNQRDLDVGESGALAILAALDLVQSGRGKRFVAMIADGASKYVRPKELVGEVTLREAVAKRSSYSVVWTHNMVVPTRMGISTIAKALGVEEGSVRVARVKDLLALQDGQDVPDVFRVTEPDRTLLLVCMAGGTSLAVAGMLSRKGIHATSLTGGIMGMTLVRGTPQFELVQPARE